MSRNPIDSIRRTAIWNTYNNKCFYCHRELEYFDIQIDHIIPERFARDRAGLNNIIAEYGLPIDFDLNSPANLVPSHSRCNNRKSGQLFEKGATLYYLQTHSQKLKAIEQEEEKLRTRKDKGQLLSRIKVALENHVIDLKELERITLEAKQHNFASQVIKLEHGFEFIDAVYDAFYLGADLSMLYHKKLLISSDEAALEVINDHGERRTVSTLNEWEDAKAMDFYPQTTYDIKMSAHFTYLENFLHALKTAKMPRYSFISEPWVSLSDLEMLSPNIIQDFEGQLKVYIDAGKSVADLIGMGIVQKKQSEYYELVLEFNGMETALSEQFRADFNGDGFESIFVKGWVRAIGGTLGFGFNDTLTRRSADELIGISQQSIDHNALFNLTLWSDRIGDETVFYFQNNGEQPIMDAVFYMDKLGKTQEEAMRSRHTMEIVFGTIPPKTTFDHRMESTDEDEIFGFPLYSGEFTAKDGTHYAIDQKNSISPIPFRSSFD
ncbi:HNH endonuclease signature motif containing protein [Pedobacter aquatilis]|uniref:HNH endonuclease n=1 Tax=Pedobacter aquatilis TaxID=351343 RepID=UPI0025B31124|nr:HNH endonuclease signature motif containing protein [Pedobacter aquatilis]MDN3585661.1 HNH endonuclease signature motif containing protein [Pedobacter aquatilis]